MLAQLTRTAVYGPVRTVVWQGSAGDRGPYADQISMSLKLRLLSNASDVNSIETT
jgi:hypothetical protein